MGTHQEGIALGFVIIEMLLAKCDKCKARGGGLYGLFDAQVDDREIIIRTSRERAEKNPHVHLAFSERTKWKIKGDAVQPPV
jgi:hypothetical protein